MIELGLSTNFIRNVMASNSEAYWHFESLISKDGRPEDDGYDAVMSDFNLNAVDATKTS